MKPPRHTTLILAALIASACASRATTWRVERDGSGDYSVLQEAADAAADGDTILIGPGRYTEYEVITEGWGYEIDVYLFLRTDNLVLIGSSPEETVIGPVAPDWGAYGPKGIVGFPDISDVTIQNIGFEYMYNCVYKSRGHCKIANCTVENSRSGFALWVDGGAEIRDCTMLGCEIGGIMMFSPSTSVQIENCYASGCWKGIHAQNTNDLQIEGFRADNCRVGLSISLGTTSEIRSCTIDGCTACSIAIGDLSTVQLYDNRFLGGDVVFLTEYASMVTGIGNVFEGGDTATIASIDAGLVLHNCHILRGTGDYVYLNGYEGESEVLDLTNNYWGTTDADQIAAWIHDGNDDPGIHAIVNFEPFSGQPLGSEQRSWGGVKALFR